MFKRLMFLSVTLMFCFSSYAYADNINQITKESVTELKLTRFYTELIPSDELYFGETKTIQEGEYGIMKLTYTVYTENGDVTSKFLDESVTLESCVNEIILFGTTPRHPDAPKEYTERFTMNATAYSLDYNSTKKRPGDPAFGITKSGMPAAYGIVAVDPLFIPLGTKLYIIGYGEAIAGDIGSAIKGDKIDLFYDTMEEALEFGRQSIDVYVLEYPDA